MLRLSVRIEAPSVHDFRMPSGIIPEVNIWRDNEGRVAAFLSRTSGNLGICFPKVARYVFPQTEANQERISIIIEPVATATRAQVIDQFMRSIVPLLLQSRGIQVLHASAIRFKHGVLGLCGRSFSGKSTLAHALMKRGYEVWADDSLLISTSKQDVRTLRTPPVQLRLRPDSSQYFGEFDRTHVQAAGDGREFEFFLKTEEAPLRALCRIQRKAQVEMWRCNRINGTQAFTEILRQANYFNLTDLAENRRISEDCLTVVSKVPIFDCLYRDGFDFIEDVVDEIERSLLQ